MIHSYPPAIFANAIYGTVDVQGGCCAKPRLRTVEHPLYRCSECGKLVKLKKVVRIEVQVIDESQEGK